MRYPTTSRLAALLAALLLGFAAQARGEDEDGVDVAELSPEAEKAIDSGLEYLVKSQNKDGSWGREHEVGHTAFALMAFMVQGHFPERPPYGKTLDPAVDFLIRRSKEGNGYIGNGISHGMYDHGVATLALAEAWGMSHREELRDVLKQAVNVIIRAQTPKGGWRYENIPNDNDISVSAMQIVALISAQEAGILVPEKVVENGLKYVKSLQVEGEWGFGYASANDPGYSRSAAAVMVLLLCKDRGKEATRGMGYLLRLPDTKFVEERFYYYGQYYAIQAMYQAGERFYQAWCRKIQEQLIKKQGKDGSWNGEGGTTFCTATAILTLGVPYRFLPIYQR